MSLIDDSADKIICFKYQVPNLVLMLKDTSIQLDPSNIMMITKVDDYEMNVRAMLKIRVRIDIRRKLWILKNKRDIVCKFELNRVGYDSDMENTITGTEHVFNNEFGIYLSDDDEALDTETMESSLETSSGDSFATNNLSTEDYFESDNVMDLYLFDSSLMNASKKIYNEVISSGIMQDIVARVLTATGHKKVLMSRIENDEVYEELLIPQLPAYKALLYLDEYYGLYKKGSIIFYDVDKLYILNTNGKLTAKAKKEWSETVLLVTSSHNSTPSNGVVRKPEEEINYVSIGEEQIAPQNPSLLKNEKYGAEAKIVVTDSTDINIEDADTSVMNQRNEFFVYTKKDDNKYAATMLKARMEENGAILYVQGENFDINAFTPNKVYTVIYEETTKQKRYGKSHYRLAYDSHIIYVNTEEYMSCQHRIVLKRCSS